jgi:hypothetical protein
MFQKKYFESAPENAGIVCECETVEEITKTRKFLQLYGKNTF